MRKGFRWDKKYLYWGITAVCVIACSILFFLILTQWPSVRATFRTTLSVLSPVLYGLMFAYMLNKLMTVIEDKVLSRLFKRVLEKKPATAKRVMRIISVTLTMVFALFVIFGSITLIVPQTLDSLKNLVTSMDSYFNTIVNWITGAFDENSQLESAAINLAVNIRERLVDWIQTTLITQADRILANVVGGVIGVIKAIANLLVGLVISVYVMYHKERFAAQAKKTAYGFFDTKLANKIVSGAEFVDRTCGSFIISKLIDTLIVGVICYVFMIIFNMPYAMLISVIIGITNIIPFFGPFIGGVPSALLILLTSQTKGIIFIIFIVVLQQIDGNIIYPKIQGSSLGLSGFWIIFSLLLFGGLFGFWGLMLGVPVFAVIYAAFRGASNARLIRRGLPAETEDYERIHIFDETTKKPVYKDGFASNGNPDVSDGPDTTELSDTNEDNSQDL